MSINPLSSILFAFVLRDLARTKSQGVRDLKSSKNIPLKSKNSLFIMFSYYNFKTSAEPADLAESVIAGALNDTNQKLRSSPMKLW